MNPIIYPFQMKNRNVAKGEDTEIDMSKYADPITHQLLTEMSTEWGLMDCVHSDLRRLYKTCKNLLRSLIPWRSSRLSGL